MDSTNSSLSITSPQVLSTWCVNGVNDSTPTSLEAFVTNSDENYSEVNLTLNELCTFANRTVDFPDDFISPRKSRPNCPKCHIQYKTHIFYFL